MHAQFFWALTVVHLFCPFYYWLFTACTKHCSLLTVLSRCISVALLFCSGCAEVTWILSSVWNRDVRWQKTCAELIHCFTCLVDSYCLPFLISPGCILLEVIKHAHVEGGLLSEDDIVLDTTRHLLSVTVSRIWNILFGKCWFTFFKKILVAVVTYKLHNYNINVAIPAQSD